ncbi:MAG: THUMP domain-containing protein [Candidatus Nanoarchaeia archaeon]
MEALVTCVAGLEQVTLAELESQLNKKGTIVQPGFITFSATKEELATFTYYSRSILSALALINHFAFTDYEELKNKLTSLTYSDLQSPFAVRCEREGEHAFTSQEVEKHVGAHIHDTLNLEVNLEQPASVVLIHIKDLYCFAGLDYAGYKLSKREYRVKTHPHSLNPVLAFDLLSIAGWKPNETLLDPFSKSGEIIIEAALSTQEAPSAFHYEEQLLCSKFLKLPEPKIKEKKLDIHSIDNLHINVRNAEVNAKLANAAKDIQFSRMDLEWLDTKFEKNSIDKIITVPPSPSKIVTEKDAHKITKELFYQAAFILTAKGTLTLLTKKPSAYKEASEQHGFHVDHEVTFDYGNDIYFILTFVKNI